MWYNKRMRDILHCDLNNFYASALTLKFPHLKGKPVAVGGKQEDRHGVVVAANYEAKKFGVKCGVTAYEAKRLCKDINLLPADFELFNDLSRKVREIYKSYTDKVEVFSIDECYLDVSESHRLFGSAEQIANQIRERVKNEIGLTISVGVSFNKTFAKIGSDLKKPDATTVITQENFKQVVWPLPLSSMIGIGKQISQKLLKLNVKTIGDLAKIEQEYLKKQFGKIGKDLWLKANGLCEEPVIETNDDEIPKSMGNSTTFYKDLTTTEEIKLGFGVIAENLINRLYAKGIFHARTLHISIKDNLLNHYGKQTKISTLLTSKNLIDSAYKLFIDNYSYLKSVRLLGISVTDFCENCEQISLFSDKKEDIKQEKVDKTIISLKNKYGDEIIGRANKLMDKKISKAFDGKKE